MNDEMEGFDLLAVLMDTLGLNEIVEDQRNEIEFLRTSVETYLRWQFCFCATSLRDDLSQWRAYSPLGNGICIEFDEGFIQEPSAQKIECVYKDRLKRQLVRESEVLNARGEGTARYSPKTPLLTSIFRSSHTLWLVSSTTLFVQRVRFVGYAVSMA